MKKLVNMILLALCLLFAAPSCRIEPPLVLPAQEVIVDMPLVLTDMQIVWDLDIDWTTAWHYGWDAMDSSIFGDLSYPKPTSFEVRRYFLGPKPHVPHTSVDKFTIYGTSFRRSYEFGYYDMLIYSNIDSKDGTQVVVVDESDLNNVTATTTVTRGMTGLSTKAAPKPEAITAVYNQPEIFYSTYPQDIYISHNFEDYDYYNEEEGVWVKVINTNLTPLVYIYLVQVILRNNEDGRVKGVSGNAAISAFANSTNVFTGHTAYDPCMVYFNTRMKKGIKIQGSGEDVDVIGGKLTTYGLCDMEPYTKAGAIYKGGRGELPNYLYLDITYFNDSEETLRFDITDQCQMQAHGGIITVYVDCHDLKVPDGPGSQGSLFVPTVEDYDEIIYDIPM